MKKIIATGKGGSGKTTVLSNLCIIMARSGRRVIVFDTDPSMNLALTFGIPYDVISTITGDKADIVHDLEGADVSEIGESIMEGHSSVTPDGIRIVVMGAVLHGGEGCLCSAVSLTKILLGYAEACGAYDVAVVDSQAGPEILGRGLASDFDCNLILCEPTVKSSEVSRQVLKLSGDLGVKESILVVNKIDAPGDTGFAAHMAGMPAHMAVGVRYDRNVLEADRDGVVLMDRHPDSAAMGDILSVNDRLMRAIGW
ncbi:MAG: AAA family ATPase [Candidatus Methanomethylophilaceae archaeon]|jgi:CO dehydrogenase maturation factor|nr:AAA family ATPase [Candidatus Methanomethylophilaceae archaeon]NLF33525.1 AAA family ATPase [Thermoplasmatales archaeon]